jgi:hypothetical protein
MPPAAPLGLAGRAIRLLEERGRATGNDRVLELAGSLDAELQRLRVDADRLGSRLGELLTEAERSSDDLDAAIAEGASERDRGLAFARRATDALVAASGGGAMALSNPAQRLSREATFFLIQAQTGALRGATLRRLTDPGAPRIPT